MRLLACLLLLTALSASATENVLRLAHYSARDGLPQQQVLSLHQDSVGYLWVGTYGGLGRYNGREFRVFSTADGLASNSVQSLASDAHGQLWVGTTRGLCVLAASAERFVCLGTNPVQAMAVAGARLWMGTTQGLFSLPLQAEANGARPVRPVLRELSVQALAADDEGMLWVGTPNGLLRVDTASEAQASVHLPANVGESGRSVNALLAEPDLLWIGTSSGLLRLGADGVRAPSALTLAQRRLPISALARGPDGALWAAGPQGVLLLGEDRPRLLGTAQGLANAVTNAVLRDREGAIWLGGDGGLSRYVPGAFAGYREREGLRGDFVRSLREDSAGRLWLGSRQGVQIVPWQGGQLRLERSRLITAADGLIDERIYDIAFPAPGEALLATAHGVAHWSEQRGLLGILAEPEGLPANGTRALHIDTSGRIWVATTAGVALVREGRARLADDPLLAQARALSIVPDRRGRLWFGTINQGLLRMDPDGAVSRYTRESGLTDEIVWHVATDADDGLWVGSNGDGLFHIDAEGRIRRYDSRDGLIDNFVWSVLVDAEGAVWAYTNRGLARLRGGSFENFGEQDGLTHPEGAATAALQDSRGQIWFGASLGMIRYAPEQGLAAPPPPPVLIERALLGNQPLAAGSLLPPQPGALRFEYAALHLQRSEQLHYRYRLRGLDADWSEPGPYRPVTYASLPAGRYVFEVAARLREGGFGAPAEFAFEVERPLWARPVFWLLAAMAVLGGLFGFFRLRLARAEARRAELEALVAQRTLELERLNGELQQASLTDPLTGLHNRRFLAHQLPGDLAQCRRDYRRGEGANRDLLFLLVDVDHFKQINDRFGHAAGDQVLRAFADALRGLMRESDHVVRYGGEEFLVVARHAEAAQASQLAERVVSHFRALEFDTEGNVRSGGGIRCTCSVGIAALPFLPGQAEALDWQQAIELADAGAYLAKREGRDRWVAVAAGPQAATMDADALVRAAREDLRGAAVRGVVRLES